MLLIDLSKQFTRGLPTEAKLDNFTKAVEMFKKQALEISASEYLIILQLLRGIQNAVAKTAAKATSRGGKIKPIVQVRASLPNVVEIVGHLRGVDVVDLSDCTLRSKPILMARAEFERYKHEELSTAFDIYFVENEKVCAKAMSRDTHKLDDFLLLLT